MVRDSYKIEEAWNAAVSRHYYGNGDIRRRVAAYFVNNGFDVADVEDLTQETFLRAYEGIETFRREANFSTWIQVVARNVMLNFLRAQKAAKRELDDRAISLDESSPDHVSVMDDGPSPMESVLFRDVVSHVTSKMPPQMLKCFNLAILGYSQKEIAKEMHLMPSTVSTQISRIRKLLAKELFRVDDDPSDPPAPSANPIASESVASLEPSEQRRRSRPRGIRKRST